MIILPTRVNLNKKNYYYYYRYYIYIYKERESRVGLLTRHFEAMPYSLEISCAESCDCDVNAYLVIELTAMASIAILTNGATYTLKGTCISWPPPF